MAEAVARKVMDDLEREEDDRMQQELEARVRGGH